MNVWGSHREGNAVLTNTTSIHEAICDMLVGPHHHHVPLRGIVNDYRDDFGSQVFYTELVAEYPEALCSQ